MDTKTADPLAVHEFAKAYQGDDGLPTYGEVLARTNQGTTHVFRWWKREDAVATYSKIKTRVINGEGFIIESDGGNSVTFAAGVVEAVELAGDHGMPALGTAHKEVWRARCAAFGRALAEHLQAGGAGRVNVQLVTEGGQQVGELVVEEPSEQPQVQLFPHFVWYRGRPTSDAEALRWVLEGEIATHRGLATQAGKVGDHDEETRRHATASALTALYFQAFAETPPEPATPAEQDPEA